MSAANAMIESELAYRAVAAALGAVGFAVRFYYQLRMRSVERVSARHLRRDQVYYWLVFAAFMLVFVYAFTPALDFAHIPLQALVRWSGLLLGILGIALLIATHRALGRNWSGQLEIADGHKLVVAGPYRRIRHPMYTAIFCTALAYSLLSANWIVAIANLAAVTLMYRARVADEEQMLIDQFGDDYRAYMRRTGRLIPKF
jgi:protein-S-isoprenylcysteine O-methyltransferase Ste14